MVRLILCSAMLLAAAGSSMAFAPAGVLPLSSARLGQRATCLSQLMAASEPTNRREVLGSATAAAFGVAASTLLGAESAMAADSEIAVMQTTAGEMVFEFWPEVAPKTVENFKKLAKTGYFDGQAFHRIIKGFVIQGGDPNSKTGYGPKGTLENADVSAVRKWGTGGPGYNINAEFNERKHEFGVLSMARSADPNSAGSQFFVCLGPLKSLDNKYTTFGRMIKGDEVLKTLGSAKTVKPGDYPIARQGIESVKIMPAQ